MCISFLLLDEMIEVLLHVRNEEAMSDAIDLSGEVSSWTVDGEF